MYELRDSSKQGYEVHVHVLVRMSSAEGKLKCLTSSKSKKKLLRVSNRVHIISLLLLMQINELDVDTPLSPDPSLPVWKWADS